MSVSMSFSNEYDNHNNHWMFVRDRDIERSDINHYYVNRSDYERIGRSSTVINNTYVDNSRNTTYVSGPSRTQVQKVVGRTITPVVIQENNKPGQVISNGQLRIYRPQVEKNNSGRQTAPTRVTNINDVKRTPARNKLNQNQTGNPENRTITQPVRTVEPQNNNIQPNQPRNVNQQENKQVQQNNVSTPIYPNRNIQPVQSPGSNPSDNNSPVRKPDAVTPQNTNQQQVPQRNVNPQNNNVQPSQQERNVTQQDNSNPGQRTSSPAKIENRTQPVQPQNINKFNNKKTVKQPKPVKQQVKKEQEKVPGANEERK
jgi:hypothetical protein